MASKMIEGNWYVSSENNKHIVDSEGFTIADATSARKALQVVREHNALRAVAPLLPSDVQEKVQNLLEGDTEQ